MSLNPTETARADHEPGYHLKQHDEAGYSSAKGSALEKGFIWIAWALAAAFIAFTMSLYIPGLLAADAEPDAVQAPPASAANPVP